MTKIIAITRNTRYTIQNGWMTDGKTDYKFHCRLSGMAGTPVFDQNMEIGDQLVGLTHDGQVLVTSPVTAVLNAERS